MSTVDKGGRSLRTRREVKAGRRTRKESRPSVEDEAEDVGLVKSAADEERERPLEGKSEEAVELQVRRGQIRLTWERRERRRTHDGEDLKDGSFDDHLLEEGSTRRRTADGEGKGEEQS
jgi:hypothetical protein